MRDLAVRRMGDVDSNLRLEPLEEGVKQLYDAMVQVAETGKGPADQIPSMGCSIKWKAA